jgi:hypothetical protein
MERRKDRPRLYAPCGTAKVHVSAVVGPRGTPGGTMRFGRVTIIPAVAALSMAGTILAAPAVAATTSHTTVYLHQTGVGGGDVYLHQ